MSLVSVPAGNFTPGASAALNFAASLINASWEQANLKYTAFENKSASLDSLLAGGITEVSADVVTGASVTEPSVTIPSGDITGLALSTFTSKYLELVALLSDKFVDFRTDYFPDEAATYGLAEDWVQGALSNPNQALPPAVAAQLLTDVNDRAYAEANVASDAVMAQFAARRFPLPPGAAASAVLQTQQKSQDVIAEGSRKLMMNYVEQMRFAVDKALNMRLEAMSAAIEYIKALASGPAMASQALGVGYDAQSKLISAAAGFYGARTDAVRMVKQNEQFNVSTKLQADEKNQQAEQMTLDERVKAMMTEAQAIAQMASSMYNNLHASSGTSYGVNGT